LASRQNFSLGKALRGGGMFKIPGLARQLSAFSSFSNQHVSFAEAPRTQCFTSLAFIPPAGLFNQFSFVHRARSRNSFARLLNLLINIDANSLERKKAM
jgi:hypothetical protein